MPATARNTAARERPVPPAFSSVRRTRPRAPRTKRSAATPQPKATGIAHAASTSVNPEDCRDSTTATGTARSATRPASTASDARWLLLRIGAANGGRRNGTPDHARHRDEREDVRKGLEQHG